MLQSIETFIKTNFTSEGVQIARIVFGVLVIGLSFAFFYLVGTEKALSEKFSQFRSSFISGIEDYMKNKKRVNKLNYDYIEKRLISHGMKAKFKNIGPLEYLAINLLLTITVGLYMTIINPLLFIPGAIVGWKLFDWYIDYSNKSDNDDMLEDIRIAIVTLKMQTRAGLYITNTLAETLTVVKNKRLKAAIIQLSGDIYNNETIDSAVDNFNAKFSNMYIDALSVIIKQNTESGKASQSLKDIETTLDTIQEAIIERQKKKIEMEITIAKLMIYGGVLAIIFYGLVLSIYQSGIMSI